MDIKKLGLISTVAMLSVTVSLGGCDPLKSEAQKRQEAEIKLEAEYERDVAIKDAQLAEQLGLEKEKLQYIEQTKRLGDMRSAMAASGLRSDTALYGLGQQMERAENERRSILRNDLAEKERHLMRAKLFESRLKNLK